MKKQVFSVVFVSVLCCPLTDGVAAPLGSPRPEAQKNFQQLLKTKSCPGCDLAGTNMTRVDLSGADLEGANLAGATFLLADLSKANLKNANLQDAAFGGADLAEADLRGANVSGAIVEGAFLGTALIDGEFIAQPLAQVEEEPVVLAENTPKKSVPAAQEKVVAAPEVAMVASATAVAEQTVMAENADPVDPAVPREVSLEEVASFSEQNTSAPVPPQETAKGIEPGGDDVISQDQRESSMAAETTQTDVDNQHSDGPVYTVETVDEAAAKQEEVIERLFDEDRCVECDLAGVDLSGKNLKEADLERAVFRGAKLSGVNFREANLKGVDFENADLRDADFREADLYRANFYGADLNGARFEEALLDSADFTGAKGYVPPEEKVE
ncbi:MAG: hypothetical protein CSB34_04035 [Desulfobulbus propionicus]|nr:MAG: hypothetical protein CSB34_04035 [Desulfobulbus propionicus]